MVEFFSVLVKCEYRNVMSRLLSNGQTQERATLCLLSCVCCVLECVHHERKAQHVAQRNTQYFAKIPSRYGPNRSTMLGLCRPKRHGPSGANGRRHLPRSFDSI